MRTARTLLRALVVGGIAIVLGGVGPATTASAEPSLQEIKQQIAKSSAELEKIVEGYNKVNVDLAASTQAAGDVANRLGPLEAQLNDAQTSVASLAETAYKTGELASVSAILDSASGDSMFDRIAVLDQLARHRQGAVAGVVSARTQVQAEKQKLDQLVATQSALRADLLAKKATIQKDLNRLYALREKAYGARTETASAGTSSSPPPYVPGRAGVAVSFAYAQLGKPYAWAQDGPGSYDCSGLTMAAWRAAGVRLTHQSAVQWREVRHISRSQLQPGDLVFYNSLGHVAIYVGNGKIIHAPTFGEVVKVASVDTMRPYGYGRPG